MFSMDEGQTESASKPVILIAEDEEDDIWLVQRAFHKAGFDHKLAVVRNGEQAIAYLSGRVPFEDRDAHPAPSLVLLDLKMPLKNGFEVLAWIREQPEFNRLPVVVLTSSQETSDVNRAYALGASSYLVKPANLARFCDMVSRLRQYCNFTEQSVGLSWL
jgi:CheY-like chemotaxis protein